MAERANVARDLQDAIATTGDDSIDVGVTGYSAVQNAATELQNADLARAEAIGIPVALVLLVLALGALAAAAVPIAVAIAGMLTAVGVLFTLTAVTAFDSLTVAMATMVGLGVGIDYAMFIVSRFREELTHHTGPDHAAISGAVGRSLATAGKTILVSGLVVMISLCALIIIQAPIFRGIAIGVATAVTSMLTVAVTLLPALLAALGPAVNRGSLPARWRPADSATDAPGVLGGRWARWAYLVMRRPVLFGTAAAAVLVLAAIVEGVANGRLVSGIVTVGLPMVVWGLFLAASPGVVADDVMKPIWAMLVVFFAVILRETWGRTLRRSNARRWSNHETA